ncbi:MAG: polysaccharide deacetylase family protein [Actinomycetota bacterium]|nr:polysaccharide deacetylase family protein [Actinomycetota bacterium]
MIEPANLVAHSVPARGISYADGIDTLRRYRQTRGHRWSLTFGEHGRSRSTLVLVAVLTVAVSGCSDRSAGGASASTATQPPPTELAEGGADGPSVPGVVYSLPASTRTAKTVLLSFDDGPNPRDTPKILAALKAAGVHALFCQVGAMTVAHPELARAEVDGGNMVCDHTHAHPHRLADRPAQLIDDEIVRGQEEIERATRVKPSIFRSPEGSLSPTVIDSAKRHGMSVYQWSIDTKDYERPAAAVIASRVLDHLSPGAIVLMHDGGGNRDHTVAALPMILRGLQARGYAAVLPAAGP